MDTFERDAARSLAISFNAYMETLAGPDSVEKDQSRCYWARSLLAAQRATGVHIINADSLLYWLTGDKDAILALALRQRASVTPEPSRGQLRSQCGMIEGPDDNEGDGGTKVPLPAPAPRKPSPGAANDIGARASAFFARNA